MKNLTLFELAPPRATATAVTVNPEPGLLSRIHRSVAPSLLYLLPDSEQKWRRVQGESRRRRSLAEASPARNHRRSRHPMSLKSTELSFLEPDEHPQQDPGVRATVDRAPASYATVDRHYCRSTIAAVHCHRPLPKYQSP